MDRYDDRLKVQRRRANNLSWAKKKIIFINLYTPRWHKVFEKYEQQFEAFIFFNVVSLPANKLARQETLFTHLKSKRMAIPRVIFYLKCSRTCS